MRVIASEKIRNILRITLPIAAAAPLVMLPKAVLGAHYAAFTLGMCLAALLLFFAGFDRREIGTRRLVLVSVMTALSVLGRLMPVIKPVTALTVLAALYLGREAGFLTGALSAVLSNFLLGQGPWTPFQMLAWGTIGFFAGMLAKPLRRSRLLLCGYGFLSGAAYSLLMDVWTTVWTYGSFTMEAYLAAAVTALPFTLLYAVSNVLFLWMLAKPFGDKLHRIEVKYGL